MHLKNIFTSTEALTFTFSRAACTACACGTFCSLWWHPCVKDSFTNNNNNKRKKNTYLKAQQHTTQLCLAYHTAFFFLRISLSHTFPQGINPEKFLEMYMATSCGVSENYSITAYKWGNYWLSVEKKQKCKTMYGSRGVLTWWLTLNTKDKINI